MPSIIEQLLQRRWELIVLLARKEWHIRYRSAKLGFAWAVLQPLMLMAVMLAIFGYVVPLDRRGLEFTEPYPLFLLSGLFPWHFASVALSSATPSFHNSRKLILLASFPREVLPLGVVAAHLVNLLLTLPLLLPLYLFCRAVPTWWVPTSVAMKTPIVPEPVSAEPRARMRTFARAAISRRIASSVPKKRGSAAAWTRQRKPCSASPTRNWPSGCDGIDRRGRGRRLAPRPQLDEIGRASCRERV